MKPTKFNFLFLAFILFSTACSKDDDVTSADFVGAYTVTETCDGADDSYTITISPVGTNGENIQIYNLWDWQEAVVATIDGNKLTIASQILDEVTFQGTGSLSDNTLTINYTTIDGSDNESCVAVGEKN